MCSLLECVSVEVSGSVWLLAIVLRNSIQKRLRIYFHYDRNCLVSSAGRHGRPSEKFKKKRWTAQCRYACDALRRADFRGRDKVSSAYPNCCHRRVFLVVKNYDDN